MTFRGNKFTRPERVLTKPLPGLVQEAKARGPCPAGTDCFVPGRVARSGNRQHLCQAAVSEADFPGSTRRRIPRRFTWKGRGSRRHEAQTSVRAGRWPNRSSRQLPSRTPVLKSVAPPRFLCLQRAPLILSEKQELPEVQPTLTFCNIAKCPIQLRRPTATLWTHVPLPHHAAPCLTPGLPLTPGGRACSRARMPVFTYVLICAFRGHPYVVLAGMVNFPSHTCQLPSSPAASDVMTATAAWACELWGRIVLSLPILLEKFMLDGGKQ